MSDSASMAAMRIAAIALLATVCGCGRQPVDPQLVGTWQTAVASPNGPYIVRFTTAATGAYRIDSQSQASGEPETGAFTASGGKWRRGKLNGGSEDGTYEVVSADTVLFKSKTETMLWQRVPSDLAATGAPVAAVPGNAAPAGLDGANGATGATQPSADLSATGPFGAPLPPSSAFNAPQRATGGDQFGSAVAAPTQQLPSAAGGSRSAGANGSTQVHSTAPSTEAAGQSTNAHRSVHDAASQGAADVQAAARKAAADTGTAASDAVNDAAVQTNKRFGQHITGFAANAGSKIKNFFTGHHQSDDDKPDDPATTAPAQTAAPTQKNGH